MQVQTACMRPEEPRASSLEATLGCGCPQVGIRATWPVLGPPWPQASRAARSIIEFLPPSGASPPGGALEEELARRRKVRGLGCPWGGRGPCRSAEEPHAPWGPCQLAIFWGVPPALRVPGSPLHSERQEPRPSPAWRCACTCVACMVMTQSLQSRGTPRLGSPGQGSLVQAHVHPTEAPIHRMGLEMTECQSSERKGSSGTGPSSQPSLSVRPYQGQARRKSEATPAPLPTWSSPRGQLCTQLCSPSAAFRAVEPWS